MEFNEYVNNINIKAEIIHDTQVRIYNELNNDVKEIKTFREHYQALNYAYQINTGKKLKPGQIVIEKEVL